MRPQSLTCQPGRLLLVGLVGLQAAVLSMRCTQPEKPLPAVESFNQQPVEPRDESVCLDASAGVEVSLRRIAFECPVGPDGQSGRVTVMNRWDVPVKVYAAVCFSDGHRSLLLFDQLAPGRAQVKATEGRCNAAASIIKSQAVFQFNGERECFSDFPDCN